MTRRNKLPHRDDLIALVRAEPTLSSADLQQRFGVGQPAVSRACAKAGIVLSRWGRPPVLPEQPIHRRRMSPDEMTAEIGSMHAADPALTAKQVQDAFGISASRSYALIKRAGIELRNPKRILPDDAELAAELRDVGTMAVAAKYGVSPDRVSRHAVRLGAGRRNRKLPPDDILLAELDVLSVAEIADKYSCSKQVVRDARVRLNGMTRPRTRLPIAVDAVPLMATAIGHLHAYRGILAAIDPDRATALLDDIEQLKAVAAALVTISRVVAAHTRTAS